MTNVQQEVPAVQPGKKVKRKRVRKKKVDVLYRKKFPSSITARL